VGFDIDANGILSVTANDKATGREQAIRIEGSGGLANDEIDRLVKDAEAHAADDKERRDSIEKRNTLDSLIYQGEKQLSENSDKLEQGQKEALEGVLAEAKQDLESDDDARIDSARQRVEAELHKLAETLYKSQTAAGESGEPTAPGPDAPDAANDDDVIDAEYTEEKGDS